MDPGSQSFDTGTLAAGWRALVARFAASADGAAVARYLAERRSAGAVIFPQRPLRALELTALADVRVVILGQDPYHGAGQAHGLAFSVPDGVRFPPSLRNILAELQRDLGCPMPATGNLERWARQGVLLLNAVFTVEEGQAASHARCGWQHLTDALIRALAADPAPRVFMLWGAHAQARRELIHAPTHCVLMANHPSPLSARRPPVPFLGCGHFSAANAFLAAHGRSPIDWCAKA